VTELANILGPLKAADKGLFKEIFDSHFKPLCAFGNKYISDPQAAEDLVQEAFVTFWNKKEDFEHFNAIKTFLYTSVRNSSINYLKHLAVRDKHQEAIIYELESAHNFGQQVIEEESFNQLYAEISHLPKSAKQIMLLALKGLKNKEIASELEISENTVKTQKKIAYSKLKDKLSPTANTFLLSL
jgi:RNA polymerase sigma-70 factor (ECF subfamily)